MHNASSVLSGSVAQFNLSPKGVPEGLILEQNSGDRVQINFESDIAGSVTAAVSEGQKVSLKVTPFGDRHPDAGPVFELLTLQSPDGLTVVVDGPGKDEVSVGGTVVRLNHARRGEVNGAILNSGEFVHLRPHGVRAIGGLKVGDRLTAVGEVRPGWSNHPVVEARSANGIEIGHPPKKPHGPSKHASGPKHTAVRS